MVYDIITVQGEGLKACGLPASYAGCENSAKLRGWRIEEFRD